MHKGTRYRCGIFEHPQYGQAARELYDQATALLDRIVADRSITARGVYGFWPAATVGEDVVLYTGEDRRHVAARFPMLRQQAPIADARPNRSLADFVAPAGDHLGAFAVGIHGAAELSADAEAEHDDYRSIMVKALADRLAEAFAEWLHLRARREWYEPDADPTSE